MKDPKVELTPAYFTLLNGNVSVDGDTIAVYEMIPDDPNYPYIQIGNWTEVDNSDKSSFGEDLTVTINIVDRFPTSAASKVDLNSVINQVKQIIRSRPVPFDLDSFNVITSTLDNETTSTQYTDTYLYVTSNIRFRHQIEEI